MRCKRPVWWKILRVTKEAGYVLDSGVYGLAAFRGAGTFARAETLSSLPAAGRRRPAPSRGTAQRERLAEQLAESSP